MLAGENGIIKNAQEANKKTGRTNIIEQARADILGVQAGNQGCISEDELEEILTSSDYNTKGSLSDEEFILDRLLT